MSLRKYLVILLVLCLCSFVSMAQEMPSVIPPAPEAASLGKYTDMPVSYSSGLPQISIPMFSATSRDISVPISLSYHAGGIRVEEIASRVGLGWNLQAGGSITRSVRGIADDGLNGWLNPAHTVTDFENAPNQTVGINTKFALMNEVLAGNNDYEPDIFNFSYPGGGGKFFFDESGDVITIPKTEHKITISPGATGIDGFVVTSPSGYKYYFGQYSGVIARENTSVDMSFTDVGDIPIPDPHHRSHTSSWHLIAIHSPVSDATVTFGYTPQTTTSVSRSSQSRMIGHIGECDAPGLRTTYTHSTHTELALSSIQFENGSINFEYSPSFRQDLPGSKALERIVLSKPDGPIKTFELIHGYFNSGVLVISPIPGVSSDHFTKRLYLDKVLETGQVGSTTKEYDLTYETSKNLPHRLSNAQDAWGFFNGAIANANLIPTRFNNNMAAHPQSASFLLVPGADRRTNSAFSIANVLTDITYPTGGSASFTYESNGANLAGSSSDFVNTYFETASLPKVSYDYPQTNPGNLDQQFTVTEADLGNTLYFDFSTTGCPEGSDIGGIPNCGIEVSLQGVTNPSYSRSLSGQKNIYFNVAPGTYRLIINKINNDPPNQVSTVTAHLSSFVNPNPYVNRSEFNVGGLRILRTILDDTFGQKIIKEYSYVNSSLKSSGFLQDNVWTFYEDQVPYCEVGYSEAELLSAQSSVVNMGSGGGHINYLSVRETALPSSALISGPSQTNYNLGYKLFRYDWALNPPNNDSFSFPYPPFKQMDWRRGNMLESAIYKKDGALSLINSQVNTYEYTQDGLDPFFSSVKAIKIDKRGGYRLWAYYDVISGNNHVLSSSITQVQDNGSMTETTDYEYNNHYLRPDKAITNHSDGQKTITKTKYTDDTFGSELNVAEKGTLASMVTANILSPVLSETFAESESTPISKSLTTFGNLTAGYLPVATKIWNRDTDSYEERLVFSYTDNGNYKHLVKDGSQQMAYIWNYANTRPTAQVTNVSDVADIAYSSFESTGKGNWTYSGSTVAATNVPSGAKYYSLNGNAVTKTGLTSSRKYVLSYWAKDGTPTVTYVASNHDAASANAFGWKYYEKVITGTTSFTIYGNAKIDELRLYPLHAQMSTYTYDPLRGVTSMGSPNNLFTHYEYDRHGRLYLVRDQDGNILKKNVYDYGATISTTGN